MSDSLNAAQAEAVQTLSGPLLVLAGAGTGKTRVVTFRVANLIRHGTRPDRILAVTFTNKAANEMLERIEAKLQGGHRGRKKQETPMPRIGTFHALCVQWLRKHAAKLGFPEKFAIYDRGDQESVARGVLRELRVHDEMMRPADLLGFISRWKNQGLWPDVAVGHASTDKEHLAASGYRRYQKQLKLLGAFDFDDLLLYTQRLFEEHPPALKAESGLFDHILVDEYQDTNGSQYAIIKAMAEGHRNLCVVGDDDQSIYGWRGAEVKHILGFSKDWPDAKVVRLEENYRSTAAILQMANQLIIFNRHRHDKILRPARHGGQAPRILQFPSEVEEAQSIAQEIARRLEGDRQLQPRDLAILFRTHEQPRLFETELRKAKVPYVLTGSQSFFDRREVRDLLAYLRILVAPEDEVALLRIINTPPRGMGDKSIETLQRAAVDQGSNIWTQMRHEPLVRSLPLPAQRGSQSLVQMVLDFQQRLEGKADLPEVVRDVIARTRYFDEIDRLYDTPEEQTARKQSVEEVVNAIAEYQSSHRDATLGGFLQEVALAGKEFGSPKEKALQQNAVALMTLHSAKGLEFPIVYLVGMEEGILPHRRSVAADADAIDEERRLCYVGVTRAQEELTLSLPLTRFNWGKARPTFPLRFLFELTGQSDHPNKAAAIRNALKEARGSADAKGASGSAKKKKPSR
ncbi:MAG: ATP-dependent helicase [Pirellulaceae bacterium]